MFEKERATLDIAMMRYAQQIEDLRRHEERQTQAFNFAAAVYAAELIAAGTIVTIVNQIRINSYPVADIVSCILPLFQVVFPALMFPLALLYLDVSVFNQMTHRMAKTHLRKVIAFVEPTLQPCQVGPDFERVADVLNKEYGIYLDNIWLLRHLLFLYAPAFGVALPVLVFYVVHRFLHQQLLQSREAVTVGVAGSLFSLVMLWCTLSGILGADRVRRKIPLSARDVARWRILEGMWHPWHVSWGRKSSRGESKDNLGDSVGVQKSDKITDFSTPSSQDNANDNAVRNDPK